MILITYNFRYPFSKKKLKFDLAHFLHIYPMNQSPRSIKMSFDLAMILQEMNLTC